MPDVLFYADTVRSPDLRHVLPIVLADSVPFVERNGCSYAFVWDGEKERVETLDGVEAVTFSELGHAELIEEGHTNPALGLELLVRACRRIGLTRATVPGDFPLAAARRLAQDGIELEPDPDLFATRRRAKLPHELAGIRRAQAATERAMRAIRDAVRKGGDVSSESLRAAARTATAEDDILMEYMIVAHGPQAASVHEEGHGRVLPGESVVVDLGVRDAPSGCWADMTRTFCVGDPPAELVAFHAACLEALTTVTREVSPGVLCSDLYKLADDIIAVHGFPTTLTAGFGISEGFFHSLGHGVGLQVHEAPALAPTGPALVVGDVITIEPGVYRPGFGGCRLEDLVLVTPAGYERLTDFPYAL